jgi:hypothetical protein
MNEMPLIVARRNGRITGFLMTTTRAMNADLPIVQAMFSAYHVRPMPMFMVRSGSGWKSVAKAWRRRCLLICEALSRGVRTFCSYAGTTNSLCVLI